MQCDRCGEVFELADKYFLHRLGHRKSTCQKCRRKFTSKANLIKHQSKKNRAKCHHCTGEFCSTEHLQKHLRSIPKEELPRSKENTLKWIKELDQAIYPSMYETTEEYRDLVQEKRGEIEDYQDIHSHYQMYNRKIDSRFTYRDIRDMLLDIYSKKRNAFKVNLGFGFILNTNRSAKSGNISTPAPIISFSRQRLQLPTGRISENL